MDKDKLAQRKAEKAARTLAALLQQAGNKSPVVENIDFKEAAREATSKKINTNNEAEALLSFLHNPKSIVLKLCKRKQCQEPFGTNYKSVAYCSDTCRSKDLAEIGIQWNPHKQPEERWGGEPPLLIPPAAILAMVKLLRKSKKHRELVDETQIQTGNSEGGEVMQSSDETQSEELLPIEAETHAALVPPTELEFSDVQQSEQSESNLEYTRLEDVQTQEDIPETNTPQELPPAQTELEKPEVKSVFAF